MYSLIPQLAPLPVAEVLNHTEPVGRGVASLVLQAGALRYVSNVTVGPNTVLTFAVPSAATNKPNVTAQSVPPISLPLAIVNSPFGINKLPLDAAILLIRNSICPATLTVALTFLPLNAALISSAALETEVPVNVTLVPLSTILVPILNAGADAVPTIVGTATCQSSLPTNTHVLSKRL